VLLTFAVDSAHIGYKKKRQDGAMTHLNGASYRFLLLSAVPCTGIDGV